ncbi:MAG: hypothetical protein U5N55_01530 [Cypionkella sp.]|nr:hypothetical protein [Cypionkella sp.]
MDISKLDFRGAAEAPQFVQFLHPVTGEPLQDGDVKIGAMVRGYQSRTVQKAIGEIERDELQGGEKLESVEDIQRRLGKQACIVTVELIGLERGGKPLTSADFAWFYDHTFLQVGADGKDVVGSFAQQALDKSKRQADFLPSD